MEENKKEVKNKKKETKEKKLEKKNLDKIKIAKKSSTKKSETNKFKAFICSYTFLYSMLGLLLVLVIFLAAIIFYKKNHLETSKADLYFPVIYTNSQNNIGVELKEMAKKGKYTIIITNNHNKVINKDQIDYTLKITNPTKVSVKVEDLDLNNSYVLQDEDITITDHSLKGKEKQEDKYIITIEDGKPTAKDKIGIEITS